MSKNIEFSNPLVYRRLKNPKFVNQTAADKNGDYIQVYISEGKKYYFKANLFD